MRDYEAQFASYLSERGLKFTRQRKSMLREVFKEHEHFDAEELLSKMRRKKIRISKATLYRTLALLVQARLLRQEVFGERHSHYEHIYGHSHHDHFVCLSCGAIHEFRNDEIERLQEVICKQHSFRATGHRMQIHGYCKECRDRRE